MKRRRGKCGSCDRGKHQRCAAALLKTQSSQAQAGQDRLQQRFPGVFLDFPPLEWGIGDHENTENYRTVVTRPLVAGWIILRVQLSG